MLWMLLGVLAIQFPIYDTTKNNFVPSALRTGDPGREPESEIVRAKAGRAEAGRGFEGVTIDMKLN